MKLLLKALGKDIILVIGVMGVVGACNNGSQSAIQKPQSGATPDAIEEFCKASAGESKPSKKTSTKFALAEDSPSYLGGIKTILDEKCVQCHASYNSFKGASTAGKQIVTSIANGSMPPGPDLLPEQVKLFEDWKADGFPEKTVAPKEDDEEEEDSSSDDSDEDEDSEDAPPKIGSKKSSSKTACKSR